MSDPAPPTGAAGRAPASTADDVAAAAARARGPQPLWALVPARARARYLARTAQAILDELDGLADLLARESGQPRSEALLAELLPAVAGLHGLADEGPRALDDRRLGRTAVLRAGRRSTLVHAPVGLVGIRGDAAEGWAEPVLAVGAALLAGNGVLLATPAPLAGERLRSAFERGGVPAGLVGIVHGGAAERALAESCDRLAGGPGPDRKGTMLVLTGAPVDRTVNGALWAGFARAGQGPAAVGRVLVVQAVAAELLAGLEAGARRLRVGDPRLEEIEVGPLRSPEQLAAVQAAVEDAVDRGATLVCGGPVTGLALDGSFFAPAVLRGVPADARVLRERVPGPVLAVVETATEAEAIALAADGGPATSVWAGDRARGERVARTLPSPLTWVNEHGVAAPAAPVRLASVTDTRQLASQPVRLRSSRWLPYDPVLARSATAAARLRHGREDERLAAVRAGAIPLARVALRVAREALRR